MSKKIKLAIGIATIILIIVCIAFLSLVIKQEVKKGTFSSESKSLNSKFSEAKFDMSQDAMPQKTENMPSESSPTESAGLKQSTHLVIRTGSINLIVKNINDSAKNITQYAESKNGWIVSSGINEQEEDHYGNVTVRVPAKIFNEAMIYFKGLAEKVSYEEVRGQDITEEYTDLQSNLKNLEATEIQLLEIMKRSGTISDVLAVQKELTTVRGQIEEIKGQIQYLKGSVEMATISINLALSEEMLPISSSQKWRPIYVVKQAWSSMISFAKGLSYFLIWIAIYAIIIVPIGIIIWIGKRKFKKRKIIKEMDKKV